MAIDALSSLEALPFEALRDDSVREETPVERRVRKAALPAVSQLSDVMNLVIPIERIHTERIKKVSSEIKEIQEVNSKIIDLLSEINKATAEVKNTGKAAELSEKAKTLISELKAKGVAIPIDPSAKHTADSLDVKKSHLSSISDENKSKMQVKFSTELQVMITKLQTIQDCFKMMLKHLDRMNSTPISHSGR